MTMDGAHVRLSDVFRHGGIELTEAEADSHQVALARVVDLDRQLADLHLGTMPIPCAAPWTHGELVRIG